MDDIFLPHFDPISSKDSILNLGYGPYLSSLSKKYWIDKIKYIYSKENTFQDW